MPAPQRCLFALWLSLPLPLLAQADPSPTTTWQLPPEPIRSLADREPAEEASLSPCRRFLQITTRSGMPDLATLARPHEKLAGLRIDVPTRGPQLGTQVLAVRLQELASGKSRTLELPAGHWRSFQWSADGAFLAAVRAADTGAELWIVATDSGQCRKVAGAQLNGVLGGELDWLPDQRTLLAKLVVPGALPARPATPAGPAVQVSDGTVAQLRTTPDLLQDAADEARFAALAQSQLATIDATTLAVAPLGAPDLYAAVDAAPDGTLLLVERIERPFSYLVPWSAFPRRTELWDRSGKRVRELAAQPLRESVPIGGVPEGKRGIGWLPVPGHVLRWTEARDGGDPKRKVEFRDEVFVLREPQEEPRLWFRTAQRAMGVQVAEDGRLALATEMDRPLKRQRLWRLDAGDFGAAPQLVFERSTQDAYGDPGTPVARRLADGRSVLRQHQGQLYRAGAGASATGSRPFLDRWDPASNRSERLWQAAEGRFESFAAFLDDAGTRLLVRSESPTTPPRELAVDLATGSTTVLHSTVDPAQAVFAKVEKQLLNYTRADGLPLSGTLYLPPDRVPDQKLPVFVWAYPLEYAQASDAGQVRANPLRYTRPRGASHLWLVLAGYAVLDDAAMPIVGPSRSANDSFVQQLRWNAEAAQQALAAHPACDATRLAVGGHSYGAFMTANLLCHTNLFAAGVARSGAYNRTLTPFGFQNEERTFWEAPEVYQAMSPFANAQRCNAPLLLIHGADDNNQGTFPIQSQRFFQALKGHGKTARLVMLPHEAHGYAARESNLHVLAETIDWLDRHVKQRPAAPK